MALLCFNWTPEVLIRPLDSGWMKTPVSLSPVQPRVSLLCSQTRNKHSLVDGMVSWLGHAKTSLQPRIHAAFWATPLHSPSSLEPCSVNSKLWSPSPQLSETVLAEAPAPCARVQNGTEPGLVRKPGSGISPLSGIIVLCCIILCQVKFPHIILSSFIAFNIRKAPLLFPHGWKQKTSTWFEKYCWNLYANIY